MEFHMFKNRYVKNTLVLTFKINEMQHFLMQQIKKFQCFKKFYNFLNEIFKRFSMLRYSLLNINSFETIVY